MFTTLREASRKKSAVVMQGNSARLCQRSMSIPDQCRVNNSYGCRTNLRKSRSLIHNNNNDSEYKVPYFWGFAGKRNTDHSIYAFIDIKEITEDESNRVCGKNTVTNNII